jgi:hypothetical protein
MVDRSSRRAFCGHLREREHLRDLGVDGKIILKCMRRHELDRDRTADCCKCGKKHSFPKMLGVS